MISLRDKVAVVTGAGRGIGAAIAGTLAKAGAHVCLLDQDRESLSKIQENLLSEGLSVSTACGSVTDSAFLKAQMADLKTCFGRVDILVNNAGIIRDHFLEKIEERDWDAVLNVNLKGPFLACQSVVPLMREAESGKIINIISRSWLGNPGQSNYSASKGGLVSLTRTLALELARFQIQVNGVSPGLIDTPMTRGLAPKVRERLIALQPTGKMGVPDDIATAVCFLASDLSEFITGQILHVDGGKSCGILGF
jgi:NAD(P)-dependent dehydrogenase (short-subunit alcohol dehydrogenase family)